MLCCVVYRDIDKTVPPYYLLLPKGQFVSLKAKCED